MNHLFNSGDNTGKIIVHCSRDETFRAHKFVVKNLSNYCKSTMSFNKINNPEKRNEIYFDYEKKHLILIFEQFHGGFQPRLFEVLDEGPENIIRLLDLIQYLNISNQELETQMINRCKQRITEKIPLLSHEKFFCLWNSIVGIYSEIDEIFAKYFRSTFMYGTYLQENWSMQSEKLQQYMVPQILMKINKTSDNAEKGQVEEGQAEDIFLKSIGKKMLGLNYDPYYVSVKQNPAGLTKIRYGGYIISDAKFNNALYEVAKKMFK